MTEGEQNTMQQALATLLTQLQQPGGSAAAAGFGQPAPVSPMMPGMPGMPVMPGMGQAQQCTGVLIPVEIFHQQMGKLRFYVSLPGDTISNPQALMMALQGLSMQMQQMGAQVAWFQKRQGWFGGGGFNGGGGRWGGNGGGFNGGGNRFGGGGGGWNNGGGY